MATITTAKNDTFIGLQLENCYLMMGKSTFDVCVCVCPCAHTSGGRDKHKI